MKLQPDAVVWIFDGRDGVRAMLADLVGGYRNSLQDLLPPSAMDAFDDRFSAMAADEQFRALDHVEGYRLQRLFPKPLSDEDTDDEVWEGMVRGRAATLHAHATTVLNELADDSDLVPVLEMSVTPWLQTLGALRTSLHAELAQSSKPDAEPSAEQVEAYPALTAVLDWLAYNIEDLLETRSICLAAGTGLDVSERGEWE